MKKIVALLLTVILVLSFVSCSLPESDPTSGVIFGSVDPFPYKDSEPKTHPDPMVEAFLNEKVTYLNKVYPDGNIPAAEKDYYLCISVYVNINLDFSRDEIVVNGSLNYDELRNFQKKVIDSCRRVVSERFAALGIDTEFATNNGKIRMIYSRYSDFANGDLIKLASDSSGIFGAVEIVSEHTEEYYRAQKDNVCFYNEHVYTASTVKMESVTPEKLEFMKGMIEYGAESLLSEYVTEIIPSVKIKASLIMEPYIDDRMPDFNGRKSLCHDSYCTSTACGSGILVDEKDIYPEAGGDYVYLFLFARENGSLSEEKFALKGISIDNGKLSLWCCAPYPVTDGQKGAPVFVVKLNKLLLADPITEVDIRLTDYEHIHLPNQNNFFFY